MSGGHRLANQIRHECCRIPGTAARSFEIRSIKGKDASWSYPWAFPA